jgi:hypothetical protein
MYALCQSSQQAYCTAHGLVFKPNVLTKPLINDWLQGVETAALSDEVAYVRTLTPALVISTCYFGNGSYATLPAAKAGDIMDCHFYSEYASTDTEGFLNGQSATSLRSRFAAVLGGCNLYGQPQFVTEWAPVSQAGNILDANRVGVLPAAVQAMIAQDVDVCCLYSWGHCTLFEGTNPNDPYNFRRDAVFCTGMPAQAAMFHDLSLRGTNPVATVTPTNGLDGAGSGSAFAEYGPYTDPALYAVPAGTKIVVSP